MNPPLKPDGTMDYSRSTTVEIIEDLADSLLDRIVNGGISELQPFLDRLDEFCPESDDMLAETKPTPALIAAMDELLQLEASDCDWRSGRARELLGVATEELQALISGSDSSA